MTGQTTATWFDDTTTTVLQRLGVTKSVLARPHPGSRAIRGSNLHLIHARACMAQRVSTRAIAGKKVVSLVVVPARPAATLSAVSCPSPSPYPPSFSAEIQSLSPGVQALLPRFVVGGKSEFGGYGFVAIHYGVSQAIPYERPTPGNVVNDLDGIRRERARMCVGRVLGNGCRWAVRRVFRGRTDDRSCRGCC
jgi:hypothetical protein